jgi:hypothetical protein
MGWKGIGIKPNQLSFWQIDYAIRYGILFKNLEELDEYLEKKNRITCIQTA